MDRRKKLSGTQMHIITTYVSRYLGVCDGTITRKQANFSEVLRWAKEHVVPKNYLLYAISEPDIFLDCSVKGKKYHPPIGWATTLKFIPEEPQNIRTNDK